MKQTAKGSRLKMAARVLFSVALISVLLYKCDFSSIVSSMRSVSPAALAVLILLHIVSNLLRAVRWKVLYPKPKFSALWATVMTAGFYGTVLPGQLFGEASKIVSLSRGGKDRGILPEEVASSVLVDKITSLIALLMLGICGALLGTGGYGGTVFPAMAAVLAVLVAVLYVIRFDWCIGLIKKVTGACTKKIPKLAKAFEKLDSFFDSWRAMAGNWRAILGSVAIGVVFHAILALIEFISGRALGLSVAFWDWAWIYAIVSVALLLPITIGGVGLREGAFVGLLGLLGVSAEKALAVSLLQFLLQIIGAVCGGVIVLYRSVTDAQTKKEQPPEQAAQNEEKL